MTRRFSLSQLLLPLSPLDLLTEQLFSCAKGYVDCETRKPQPSSNIWPILGLGPSSVTTMNRCRNRVDGALLAVKFGTNSTSSCSKFKHCGLKEKSSPSRQLT